MIRYAALMLAVTFAPAAVAKDAPSDELLAVAPDQLDLLWQPERTHWQVELANTETLSVLGGCATATLIIEKDGRTSDVKVVRTIPEGAYDLTAKRLFKRMRFAPTALNKQPEATYSAMTITFEPMAGHTKAVGSNVRRKAPDPQELRKACAIQSML
jgi:hypothetical protein